MSDVNKPLLLAGIGLVVGVAALAVYLRLRPCPCKQHTDGEAPLEDIARASAEIVADA